MNIGDKIVVVAKVMEIIENKDGRFLLVEPADGKGSTCMRVSVNDVRDTAIMYAHPTSGKP